MTCGATEASCTCGEPEGHPPPHECEDKVGCNGAWWIDEDGNFQIHRLPMAPGLLDWL